uniref:Uncharacterized protein n=1 Tax=Clytia hemisphaerica TaxID=252671 RepID=A0A7M5XKE1_9CNID
MEESFQSSQCSQDGGSQLYTSDDEYIEAGSEKENFNKSMSSMKGDWTPVKYQLHTDFDSIDPRSQQRVMRTSIMAVDTVLENIAPGQSERLKQEFSGQAAKSFNLLTTQALQDAVTAANSSNVKVQLLSILCGKDENGDYKMTIAEMLSMFPSVKKKPD